MKKEKAIRELSVWLGTYAWDFAERNKLAWRDMLWAMGEAIALAAIIAGEKTKKRRKNE